MKKVISLLVSVIMAVCMIVPVQAENQLANAKNYILGASKSGNIVEGDESDIYVFELLNAGKISLNFSAEIKEVYLKLYDKNGNEMWSESPYWNSTTEQISYQTDFYLCKGIYYFSVSKYSGYGDYEFTISETAIYETFAEEANGSNNSTKTAELISHGNEYIGCIAMNDDVDMYKFDLTTSGKLTLNLTADIKEVYVKLYDVNGKQIWDESPYWNSTTEQISYQQDLYLCKGPYYFSVSKYSGYGEYKFGFTFTSANESFAEEQEGSNNKINSANNININQKYNGFIAMNDDVDIYRIVINDPSVTFSLSADLKEVYVKLYDENGKEILSKSPYWNHTIERIDFSEELKLASGLYYCSISKYSGYGNYTFNFSNGGAVTDTAAVNAVISVKINGSNIAFDQPPVLENGRTLVPLRAIFEALGATVNWDDNTQTVIATKDNIKIVLQIGSTRMFVNDFDKTLDVPAKLINSRTLVPVRAISESFGCKVDWDGNTQTVIISQ